MRSSEIRRTFLEYFKEKGHEVVSSSPLIPGDDPTLLFTNAGMVQFKSVFLGHEKRNYLRATTVQKCLRAGGKHNDLENVGKTARHHTFFEMLGNFSFGDYFKKEAIEWAWEFLTERVKLPVERLYVTVYEKDDEAEEIWNRVVGVPSDRIYRLGEKDNFWQMGDTGPCGPCSEIVLDQGSEIGCGRPECTVGCDCDRFLEIWNLVFMQYNRDPQGNLSPLPKPSIDTGMGLERLAAVLQGKTNNFDTDLFIPIISHIEEISNKQYGKDHSTDVSMRVIADHIRAITFVLAEGLTPSNEGRGYVLRRIIRRAARHGFMLGVEGPFLYRIIDTVNEIMGNTYPEILDSTEMIRKVLKFEEERFANTLTSGMSILDDIIKQVKASGDRVIPGSEIFRLYDTYGFPVDLARDIAEDNGLEIDEKGFEEEMEIQRERARASWTGLEEEISGVYKEVLDKYGPTEFVGYEGLRCVTRVLAIIKDREIIKEAHEGEEVEIILERTPFYGEAGGQVGDTGMIKAESVRIEVRDTKRYHGIFTHISRIKRGMIRQGMEVSAEVLEERRNAIKRNHTATHLLHAALRHVLGDHVKQSGSLVAPDRLRFDFTHFFGMSEKEITEVEDMVNEKILENLPVTTTETSLDEALKSGVVALFGEKYGEKVRVVRAGDFSAELCGGTHCSATGEIGQFRIVSESSIASGVRRIEAVTGRTALEFERERERELKKLSGLLRVDELKTYERVEKLLNELKQKERELERARQKAISIDINEILNKASDINGIKVISHALDGMDIKSLRSLSDRLKERIGSGVIVLGSSLDGQAYFVSAVTRDLTDRLHAGEILKSITGGKGGGRPDMAQGGSKDASDVERAISIAEDIIRKYITQEGS